MKRSPSHLIDGTTIRDIRTFIEQHCIVWTSDSEKLRSESGNTYRWMFDLRPLLLNGRMLGLVSGLFWDVMSSFWPFQVAGLEMTAIPLIAGILVEGERRGFAAEGLIVRRKRKKYARERLVEGQPVPGRPVVLVDDSINSARSINMTLSAMRNEGLAACAAFAIIDFNSPTADNWCNLNQLTISSLFTPADFGLSVSSRNRQCSTSCTVAWRFASPNPNYRFAVAKSAPAIYRDSVMFGSDSGIFWCLQKKTGGVNWKYDTKSEASKGILSSPVISEGRVYFGNYHGRLYCLDASDGREIWNEHVCDWIGSSPCYANGYIYIGLEYDSCIAAGGLAKFCAMSGRRVWEVPTRQMLHGSPVYSEKHCAIVVGTNDATVLVIHAGSGEVLRFLKVGGPVKYHCGLSEDLVVFGSFDGKIYVWNFVEDSLKLEIQTEDIVYSRPLISDGLAFVGCADHTIRVLDLRALYELKRIDVGEKVHSSPALVGQTVFLGTSGGELIGISRNSLEVTHRWQFPERLTNSIVYDDGMLYVYAYDNKLWVVEHAI
jgi:outer membrane protein assembly factor BamB/orotate phosphoribosyltransferase